MTRPRANHIEDEDCPHCTCQDCKHPWSSHYDALYCMEPDCVCGPPAIHTLKAVAAQQTAIVSANLERMISDMFLDSTEEKIKIRYGP